MCKKVLIGVESRTEVFIPTRSVLQTGNYRAIVTLSLT